MRANCGRRSLHESRLSTRRRAVPTRREAGFSKADDVHRDIRSKPAALYTRTVLRAFRLASRPAGRREGLCCPRRRRRPAGRTRRSRGITMYRQSRWSRGRVGLRRDLSDVLMSNNVRDVKLRLRRGRAEPRAGRSAGRPRTHLPTPTTAPPRSDWQWPRGKIHRQINDAP